MATQIKNKCALVTGGSNGIGFICTKELLRHGAKVVFILDKVKSDGTVAVQKLTEEFGKERAIFFECDVTKEEEFTANFKKANEICQGLDIVINNAGIFDEKRWELMIDVNYKAVVRGTLLAINLMGKHIGGKGGTVLNVASITGLKTIDELPIYSGTKSAVLGFCLGIKNIYNRTGVRILAICPGVTKTNLVSGIKDKLLDVFDEAKAMESFSKYPTQSPEAVAVAMMEMIERGNNGAVWVAEGNEPPYAVEMPHYSNCRVSL